MFRACSSTEHHAGQRPAAKLATAPLQASRRPLCLQTQKASPAAQPRNRELTWSRSGQLSRCSCSCWPLHSPTQAIVARAILHLAVAQLYQQILRSIYDMAHTVQQDPHLAVPVLPISGMQSARLAGMMKSSRLASSSAKLTRGMMCSWTWRRALRMQSSPPCSRTPASGGTPCL